MAPPANIAAYGAQQPPQLPPMINPQDAYAAGIQVPALPPSLSAINAAAPPNAPPTPMPGRPPDVPVQPDFVQQMFLNTLPGRALNAVNGGNLGTYRVPRVSPQIHQRLMAQQSPGSRGQDALRAAGMLDQFGMII
jgi:hypothetical protein